MFVLRAGKKNAIIIFQEVVNYFLNNFGKLFLDRSRLDEFSFHISRRRTVLVLLPLSPFLRLIRLLLSVMEIRVMALMDFISHSLGGSSLFLGMTLGLCLSKFVSFLLFLVVFILSL